MQANCSHVVYSLQTSRMVLAYTTSTVNMSLCATWCSLNHQKSLIWAFHAACNSSTNIMVWPCTDIHAHYTRRVFGIWLKRAVIHARVFLDKNYPVNVRYIYVYIYICIYIYINLVIYLTVTAEIASTMLQDCHITVIVCTGSWISPKPSGKIYYASCGPSRYYMVTVMGYIIREGCFGVSKWNR